MKGYTVVSQKSKKKPLTRLKLQVVNGLTGERKEIISLHLSDAHATRYVEEYTKDWKPHMTATMKLEKVNDQ